MTRKLVANGADAKRLHIILKKMMQNIWGGFDEWLWLHQEKMCHGLWKPCPHCEGDEEK
tara:strand:- start:241 stop:417 length:177 start_codon:yes stop_codon:yes gene_type:complete